MGSGDIVRKCHADADQPVTGDSCLGEQLSDRTLEESAYGLGFREGDFARRAGAHFPDEVENDDRDVVAVNIEADGETTVGIDDQLGRRLAASTAHAAGLEYQSVVEQSLGDVGDRRGGKPGQCG